MNNPEDVVLYQLQAEIALEDGDVEKAQVYATLASSAARALLLRGTNSVGYDRDEVKDRLRSGGWPVELLQARRPGPPNRPDPRPERTPIAAPRPEG